MLAQATLLSNSDMADHRSRNNWSPPASWQSDMIFPAPESSSSPSSLLSQAESPEALAPLDIQATYHHADGEDIQALIEESSLTLDHEGSQTPEQSLVEGNILGCTVKKSATNHFGQC
jgi:hypothetical protein